MWKSVSPLYRDRGCILRSGARRRRHVTLTLSVASPGKITSRVFVQAVWVPQGNCGLFLDSRRDLAGRSQASTARRHAWGQGMHGVGRVNPDG